MPLFQRTRLAALSALVTLLLAASAPAQNSTTAQDDEDTPAAKPVAAIPSPADISASIDAQTLAEDRGAAGLWQTLVKLHTRASMMVIVAHPDDEDGGMLVYESRGVGARVAVMTLTRGEGGQNAMSGEANDALALLRTGELLKADQYYGVDQYWSRAVDYGFSKTIDEAFSQWGHDRVLYDAVRAVRLYRPLVITSTFVGGITDGHGQHQVSGELAQEVFTAAGDPGVFPDQIAAGLRPWSPLKVYAREPFFSITAQGMFDYATGKWAPVRFYNYIDKQWTDAAPSVNVHIAEGAVDPVLGRSYLQMAQEGWGEQKSQNGGGRPPLAGDNTVGYHRYASRAAGEDAKDEETGFFDGVDVSLVGIATLAHGDSGFLTAALRDINQHVVNAMLGFTPSNPRRIAPELRDGLLATQRLITQVNASSLSADDKANINFELGAKVAQFNHALVLALGLDVAALVTPPLSERQISGQGGGLSLIPDVTDAYATPGTQINVRLHVSSAGGWGSGAEVQVARTWLQSNEETGPWIIERLAAPGLDDSASTSGDALFRVEVPMRSTLTRPYFTRPNIEQPFYDVSDTRWINQSYSPYPLEGWAEFTYGGATLRVGQVVQAVRRERGPGTFYQPLMVAPGISVETNPPAGILPLGEARSVALRVRLHCSLDGNNEGTLRLELPQGWTAEPASLPFRLHKGEDLDTSFTLHPGTIAAQEYAVRAIARSGNFEYSESYQSVGTPGFRPFLLYRPAEWRLRGVDVKVAPGLKVGYVTGTGDDVPQALAQLGVETHLLSAEDIASGDLSHYDAIVLGIRAYAARPELAAANRRLLDYVQGGGCLVVQYNSEEYDHNYGPYPLSLGRSPEKVVDETAPVTLAPSAQDKLLAWPNQITPADFNYWIEERGHSFLASWDPRYAAPTETHDPGQDPQRGGLVYARYGKGIYIYTAFALHRQLPENVPGAYRLLANLISATHAP